MNKKSPPKTDRGTVKTINLKKPITFNGNEIKRAVVEIDHINYGLDSTGNLKKKKRSNFTMNDVEKFIGELNNEFLIPIEYSKHGPRFLVRIDCPVQGPFYKREFIMIFTKDFKKEDEIYTITIYPGR